jgi:hypothetical protein
MADYINIYGQDILAVASDPANPTLGQIWYNTTSNTLKGQGFGTAAFSSGPTMAATARRVAGTTGNSVDQAIAVGGYIGPTISNSLEEYSGTAWSTGANIPTATYGGACCGTQTATLFGLGNFDVTPTGDLNTSYEYDGATWTSGGTLSLARHNLNSGIGTQTAAVFCGGYTGPTSSDSTATEKYDGTSWTNGNAMNIARGYPAGIGIETAGLVIAGPAAPSQASSEEYDGTSWTTSGNLPGPRGEQPSLFGIQTSAIAAGGNDGSYMNSSITYDGTSWAANPATLITARGYGGGAGTSSSGIVFSGFNGPSNLNSSEIYTGAAPTTVTITAS